MEVDGSVESLSLCLIVSLFVCGSVSVCVSLVSLCRLSLWSLCPLSHSQPSAFDWPTDASPPSQRGSHTHLSPSSSAIVIQIIYPQRSHCSTLLPPHPLPFHAIAGHGVPTLCSCQTPPPSQRRPQTHLAFLVIPCRCLVSRLPTPQPSHRPSLIASRLSSLVSSVPHTDTLPFAIDTPWRPRKDERADRIAMRRPHRRI